MALLLSLVLRVTALAELDREQHPLLYSGGVSQEQCADGKLLVVSVPQSAPPCMWSAVSAANLSQLPPACGLAPDGTAMQIAPCQAADPVCAAYGKQYARSWFTPHVYRLPSYGTHLPLQRTWLLARLTAVDSASGGATEPCVTHDASVADIRAVLLVSPPYDILNGSDSIATTVCAGFDASVVRAFANETIERFKRAAAKVPHYRRFVVSMAQLTDEQADSGYLAFAQTVPRGLRAWGAAFADLIESTNATFVNRGGTVLVDEPPVSGKFPLASPYYGTITNKIAASSMSNYMGWATNIDSAFTPVSKEDMASWQSVLRKRALLPASLADEFRALLNGSKWADVLGAVAVAAALAAPSASAAITAQLVEAYTLSRVVSNNGAPHGFSACLRQKLLEACDDLPTSLCSLNTTAIVGPAAYGVTSDGLQPTGSNATCEGTLPFYALWGSSTFCLMPGGDVFDRGATVQALDIGCIPVFFSGSGRGDLLRRAFSRSFFGTDDPDQWSVLLHEETLIGCAGSADDGACPATCADARTMGRRLAVALGDQLHRAPAMREYLINTLPLRSQFQLPVEHDFVRRFVDATVTAEAGAPAGPGNVAGQPDTWVVPRQGELAPRPSGQPPCYLRKSADGGILEPATCLPGFLVVGPQKTGTSALYEYLAVQPQLQLSPKKEMLHWGPPHGPNSGHFNCSAPYARTYLNDFVQVRADSGNMTGDFTATDIACTCCAPVVRSLAPNIKIIIMFRDPVERAQSRFKEQYALHAVITTHPSEDPSIVQTVKRDGIGCNAQCLRGSMMHHINYNLPILNECLATAPSVERRGKCVESQQILGWSLYDTMVNVWLGQFPLKQMMFVSSAALESASVSPNDEGLNRTRAVLRAIEQFLGVQPALYSADLLKQRFNTGAAYGWNSSAPSDGDDEESSAYCDDACVNAANVTESVRQCLDSFYKAYTGVYDPAGKFLASGADFCAGESCSFYSIVLPTQPTRFNAVECLKAAHEDPPLPKAAWLHIPKAGTSFLNTVSHWLDAHKWLPPTAEVPSCELHGDDACSQLGFSPVKQLQTFSTIYPPYFWAGPHRLAARMDEGDYKLFCYNIPGEPGVIEFEEVQPNSTAAVLSSQCANRGHKPILRPEFEQWRGDWVAMIRQPASRALSMYNYIPFTKLTNDTLDDVCHHLHGDDAQAMTPLQYVRTHAGLMVRQISGEQDGKCGFQSFCHKAGAMINDLPHLCHVLGNIPEEAPTPNVALAIERLDGFKFMGLFEEWPLSVCLFHVMHGGECFPVENDNSRAGSYEEHADLDALAEADPWDAALYSAAKARFYQDIAKHNVTRERCRSVCPSFAHAFDDPASTSEQNSTSNSTSGQNSTYASEPSPSISNEDMYEELNCQKFFATVVRETWLEPLRLTLPPANLLNNVQSCLSRGYNLTLGLEPIEQVQRPNIVTVGIGDSSTQGVHNLLSNLGLAVSLNVAPTEEDLATYPSTLAIPALLTASSGDIARDGYARSTAAWDSAVWLEQMGAFHSRRIAAPAPDQPWGFMSSRQVFLLPALVEAYRSPLAVGPAAVTTLLVVARDPRDVCTAENMQQFELFAPLLNIGISSSEASEIAQARLPSTACFRFWAKSWRQVLPSLGGQATVSDSNTTRLVVVRIEDLVGASLKSPPNFVPDGHDGMMSLLADAGNASANFSGNTSGKAHNASTPVSVDERLRIANCILGYAGLSNQPQAKVVEQLNIMHALAHDYGSGASRAPNVKQSSERLLSAFTEVHDVMHALGYDIDAYGRGPPNAPEVITSNQCLR